MMDWIEEGWLKDVAPLVFFCALLVVAYSVLGWPPRILRNTPAQWVKDVYFARLSSWWFSVKLWIYPKLRPFIAMRRIERSELNHILKRSEFRDVVSKCFLYPGGKMELSEDATTLIFCLMRWMRNNKSIRLGITNSTADHELIHCIQDIRYGAASQEARAKTIKIRFLDDGTKVKKTWRELTIEERIYLIKVFFKWFVFEAEALVIGSPGISAAFALTFAFPICYVCLILNT
jgi:hypothetical protein